MLVTNPVKPSTAICQRPGTSSRFIPPSMNSHRQATTTAIQAALLVKAIEWPAICQPWPNSGSTVNWCIGSTLPDSAATLQTPSTGRSSRLPAGQLDDAPEPADGAKHHQRDQKCRRRAEPAVEHPADERAPEDSADQVGKHAL